MSLSAIEEKFVKGTPRYCTLEILVIILGLGAGKILFAAAASIAIVVAAVVAAAVSTENDPSVDSVIIGEESKGDADDPIAAEGANLEAAAAVF
jgi:hypothetical protein